MSPDYLHNDVACGTFGLTVCYERKLCQYIFNNFMFVVIADIKIKQTHIDDFKRWFSESNNVVSKFGGFVSRRLLETANCQHRIIVEFTSREKFMLMHQSQEHAQLHTKALSYMEGLPLPVFYSVVAQ